MSVSIIINKDINDENFFYIIRKINLLFKRVYNEILLFKKIDACEYFRINPFNEKSSEPDTLYLKLKELHLSDSIVFLNGKGLFIVEDLNIKYDGLDLRTYFNREKFDYSSNNIRFISKDELVNILYLDYLYKYFNVLSDILKRKKIRLRLCLIKEFNALKKEIYKSKS